MVTVHVRQTLLSNSADNLKCEKRRRDTTIPPQGILHLNMEVVS